MSLGGSAQILGRDVQVDLRAGDVPMAEQIPNGDDADAFAHEVRGECVPQPMRT